MNLTKAFSIYRNPEVMTEGETETAYSGVCRLVIWYAYAQTFYFTFQVGIGAAGWLAAF